MFATYAIFRFNPRKRPDHTPLHIYQPISLTPPTPRLKNIPLPSFVSLFKPLLKSANLDDL